MALPGMLTMLHQLDVAGQSQRLDRCPEGRPSGQSPHRMQVHAQPSSAKKPSCMCTCTLYYNLILGNCNLIFISRGTSRCTC